jgi:hypothetical protein
MIAAARPVWNTPGVVIWGDPQHVAVNAVAAIVWIAAAVLIARTPERDFKNGRRGKIVALLLALAPTLYVGGFVIPLGAVFVLLAYRKQLAT